MRIQVGDPSIDWLALQPQFDRKDVVVVEGGARRVVGSTSEWITLVEAQGRPALQRVQVLKSKELGNRRAETVVFRKGFAPYTHSDAAGARTLSIRYRGNLVVGERRMGDGEIVPISIEVTSPVFDAHAVEMVLRVLPLAGGYVAELPVFHPGRGVQMLVIAEVINRDTTTSCGCSVDAWEVETSWEHVRQRYWIGVENRALLRQVSELSEGSQLAFTR